MRRRICTSGAGRSIPRRAQDEELFRTLTAQGFAGGDLRVAEPEARARLVMATLVAAVIVRPLVHARDGAAGDRPLRPVTDAFAAEDRRLLEACCAALEGKTPGRRTRIRPARPPMPPGSAPGWAAGPAATASRARS